MDYFFLTLGVILLLSLVGGLFAYKLKQSPMIGYLSIGLIVGALVYIPILTDPVKVLIYNSSVIQDLSQIGLIMLLFFIGLNISPRNFTRIGKLALVLATVDLTVTIFTGFIIGKIFRWDFADTLFLAFIISQSSIIITAKSIEDLKRLTTTETETLLATLILEDFISIILVFFANGYMVTKTTTPAALSIETVGIIVLLLFFIFLMFFAMPFLKNQIFRAKNDEFLIIFALSALFLVSALLNVFGVTPAIGGFFVGMIFSETKLAKDFELKLAPIKYAFASIFFVTFGFMINLPELVSQWNIIIVSTIFIVIDEVIILSIFAYMFGFSSKSSVLIGSGALPRTEGSVIFANIAVSIFIASGGLILTKAYVLVAITGGICILTSVATPFFLRNTESLSNALTKLVPKYLRYSGSVISRTLKPLFFPRYIPLRSHTYSALIVYIVAFAYIAFLLFYNSMLHIYVYIGVPILLYFIWWATKNAIRPIIHNSQYLNIGMNRKSGLHIQRIVTLTITVLMGMIIVISALWNFNWIYALAVIFFAVLYLQ
ncbi:MAG: cation:proton antiporter, partial [Thermoplasmata archaeon]